MDGRPVPSPDEDGAAARFRVDIRPGEPSVITVSGDTDLDSTGPLREAVLAALDRHQDLVFDLAGVAFADSSFLNVLLLARSAALERKGSVRLYNAGSQVRRLLDVTGAAALFPALSPEQSKQP
ncbi:STAS domain-containing protein [Streptomyces sp. NPDC049040]|uniref:STAS domain-containing protein n=1 Tax=Streptomyces sp. NPDC049040 TaxID=3365593 RepID=UPI0037247AE9